jgi:hypothetical protein
MAIRTFRPGDEAAQVSIYNEAAATLPKFKPATLDEVRRRSVAADFDASARFFAEVDGRLVGYASFQRNGRISYPWCRAGHVDQAEPLFLAVIQAMAARGLPRPFAAYRGDWRGQCDFFTAHGFRLAREMVNFVLDLADMPTPAAIGSSHYAPLGPGDVPAILAMAPQALQARTKEGLEKHLLQNPYFKPDSVFTLRGRTSNAPVAVGVLIHHANYANPTHLDSAMPCFRLGAFGTEGMAVKRVNGLFSFLTAPGSDTNALALNLMSEAAFRLRDTDADCLAAQAPSDASHLLRFYQQYFRRQGSFPVFERELLG